MVKLLTDYTTQIYHALSTDARPDADPGDQLREIDTGKRFIFDGTSWLELPDGGGGGGGGGVVLLASGEYTAPSNVINMAIPVSYSGTPKFTMLVANEPPADTAQTVMAFFIPSFPVIGKTLSPNGFGGYVSRSATNVLNHAVTGRSNSTFKISSAYLTFGRPAPGFPWIDGVTYQWYIYGEVSA